jgi:hypothetical protein
MSSYFVINAAGEFYRHLPGCFVSWGPVGHANEFQTVQSARYVSDNYKGARVVEMKGKKIVEVE